MADSCIKSGLQGLRNTFFSKLTIRTFLGVFLVLGWTGAANAQANTSISGTYKIKYNGMSMGKLHFNTTIRGRSYKMESNSKLAIPLLGSIFNSLSWRGLTRASGTVQNHQAKPDVYHFAFRSGKKSGTVDMNFSGNTVTYVNRIPNKPLSSSYVPVERRHLQHVTDPMSALMMISRKGRSHRSACNRTLPIYDGKQRFNLKLSYKRSTRVSRSQSGGYAGPIIVCRVRYQPISGYKPHKKDIKFMKRNRNIEMWLMPLPKSRSYAPYRLILPLPIGTADAYLVRFNIRQGRNRQIALVK